MEELFFRSKNRGLQNGIFKELKVNFVRLPMQKKKKRRSYPSGWVTCSGKTKWGKSIIFVRSKNSCTVKDGSSFVSITFILVVDQWKENFAQPKAIFFFFPFKLWRSFTPVHTDRKLMRSKMPVGGTLVDCELCFLFVYRQIAVSM